MNGDSIPVWISDYVLVSYGTGAIMAVPAHDDRDWDFAKKFDLPIVQVVASKAQYESGADFASEPAICDIEDGYSVNSGEFDGLETETAKLRIVEKLERDGMARGP